MSGSAGTIGAAGAGRLDLLRAQTYFDAAFELAEELIAELGEPADAAVGLLIVQRGHGALNRRDDDAGGARRRRPRVGDRGGAGRCRAGARGDRAAGAGEGEVAIAIDRSTTS